MEIQKFIENFAEAIEVNSSVLSSNTNFKEIDKWDSMCVLSVIAMVDEYYGKVLSGDDLNNTTSIEELFRLILNK